MPDMIHVQPEPARRSDFAAWAVAQDPKIRTVSSSAFAVPAARFTHVPEHLLIGSHVDGHRYVSPEEEDDGPRLMAAPDELTGDARPEGFVAAGRGGPVVVEGAGGAEPAPRADAQKAADAQQASAATWRRTDARPTRRARTCSRPCGIHRRAGPRS